MTDYSNLTAREKAIQTMHELGRPERSYGRLAFFDGHPDDILYMNSGVYFTVGDVRELQTLLIELGYRPKPTRAETILAAVPTGAAQ